MKPKKPYPDFPLTPHATGQWCKKIGGRQYYFGTDWKKALKRYNAMVEEPVYRGKVIAHLVDAFMDGKKRQGDTGEIRPDTVKEYHRVCKRMVEILGKYTPLNDLTPEHFIRLRADLSDQMSVVTLKGQLTRLRTLFDFAYESGLVEMPMRYKHALKSPSAKLLRQAKTKKLFTAKEIRALVEKATGYMKPSIWLGINCGLGCTDVCSLRWSNISGRWLEFPRPKTAVERRVYLWPETIAALGDPKEGFVCTGVLGQKLGDGESNSTPIPHLFGAVEDSASVPRKGFYALRHTYRTVADGCKDEPAVYLTMGHADTRIAAQYRHMIEPERLIAVSEFVRSWLLG